MPTPMTDGELEDKLRQFLSKPSIKFPASSSSLLGCLISEGISLRLSDRERLESLLLKLAHGSNPGSNSGFISVKTDTSGVSVMNLNPVHANYAGHKRKYSELEDPTTLGSDMFRVTPTASIPSAKPTIHEIFSMLQKGTARTRLLAERVRVFDLLPATFKNCRTDGVMSPVCISGRRV
jgi:hypothetical protein